MNNFVRGVARLRDKVTKSEFERILHKTTSNEETFPPEQMLKIVSDHTYNKSDYTIIVDHLRKKLQSVKKKWRKILKCLQLIQYLIKHGNKRILKDLGESIFLIKMLEDFNCIDQGADRGVHINELATKTLKLIQANKHLLKDKKYEKEINFKGKPAPRSKNAIKKSGGVSRRKPGYQASKQARRPQKKRPNQKQGNANNNFEKGFLELDFDEDKGAIEQEKFYKKQAERQRFEKLAKQEEADLKLAIELSKKQAKQEKARFEDPFKVTFKASPAKKDPFGGFNNEFSTSPNKKKVIFEPVRAEKADPFGGFNTSGTRGMDQKESDPFGGFGGNEFGTSPSQNNFWGQDSNENGFGTTPKAQKSDPFAIVEVNDSGFKKQNAQFQKPKEPEQEVDLMGEFSNMNLGGNNQPTPINSQPQINTTPQTGPIIDLSGLNSVQTNPQVQSTILNTNTTAPANDNILDLTGGPTITPQPINNLGNLNLGGGINQSAHFTTNMSGMNVQGFQSMTSGIQVNPLIGAPTPQQQQQLLQQQMVLLKQKQLQEQLSQNIIQSTNMGQTNTIQFNTPQPIHTPAPQTVEKTEADLINLDLLA